MSLPHKLAAIRRAAEIAMHQAPEGSPDRRRAEWRKNNPLAAIWCDELERETDRTLALEYVMRRPPEPLPWDDARVLLVALSQNRGGELSDAVELAIERAEFRARERWWESLKAARKNRRNYIAVDSTGVERRTYCPVCRGTGYTTGAYASYGGLFEKDRHQPWIRKPCEICRTVRPGRPATGYRRNVAEAAEWLTRDAERHGYTAIEFVAPFPRGHQTLELVLRRRHLAAAVAQLADDGFTQKTIETATGLSHAVTTRLIKEGAVTSKPAELRPSTYWAFKDWTPVHSEDPTVLHFVPPRKEATDKTRHLKEEGHTSNSAREELAA